MFIRMGNSAPSSKRDSNKDSAKDRDNYYPAETAVAELLARTFHDETTDRLDLEPSPLPTPSTEERQHRALVRMSADLLAEKQRREKLEESKFELEAEVQRIKREQKLRNSLVADGLDAAKPDEIASKFILLREKHKKIISDNDLLKERLRDRNEISIKDDSRQNAMMRELKSATEQSDRYLEEMGKLSKRLKDQKKLEDLCKEQEKIISKLEDLFSKTRINIDSRWKDDVDRMVNMTKTREKYHPNLYQLPQYGPESIRRNPMIEQDDEIESERYRANMLERQVNEMAREHAREKQDLIQRLEELKFGFSHNSRTPKPFPRDEYGDHGGNSRLRY